VIDFGGIGVGDPAAAVIAARSMFGDGGRDVYREALGVDDGTTNRARGYPLHQTALIIPYYADTNSTFVVLAKRTVEEILAIAVVRADAKIVGLTLSLKTGADLEVLMPVDVARRLTDASHAVLAIGCDRR
jgi:hypothetical protein